MRSVSRVCVCLCWEERRLVRSGLHRCCYRPSLLQSPGNGFSIVGAHTDSPNLRVKAKSKISAHGFLQVGVECYGGGLWHTWFDRDLSIAGRVFVESEDGSLQHRLVDIKDPILSLPNLAIHLNRSVKEGFVFNYEKHLVPFIQTALEGEGKGDASEKHHSALVKLLAERLETPVERIRDFELSLYDTQTPAIVGLGRNGLCGAEGGEFVHSARIDNLASCFCGVEGLVDADKTLEDEQAVRVLACFDHEECGSGSAQGAASSMMTKTLERLARTVGMDSVENVPKGEDFDIVERSFLSSFCVSADGAHAAHPNYPEKHEQNHRPMLNRGPTIKHNSNQRYATNAMTALLMKEIASKHSIPLQEVMVANDSPCGTTIGPIFGEKTGIRTMDIGIPQLAMHSIREMCGAEDFEHFSGLLSAFYSDFKAKEALFAVDA
uniref:aspartyl aminopeptidase n=1 Tax=Palpitomonas bilix TaxID=652834 RepID=A0A7S3LVN6_9EUKA|mmetsp:Transcript_50613/g.130498  ORF Transcript_50613/g.130498 Transcript_50613/m.130498 type:complete len:436 (+) Transcript_50613:407-1714(+)